MTSIVQRTVSFAVCLLMMIGAAINCNKTILGKDLSKAPDNEVSDSPKTDIYYVDESGSTIIDTSTLTDITGFAGKTPLKITINADGIIENIEPLPNTETPGFFSRASALLDNWKGKSIDEASGLHVDAVSGATMSSDAITGNMHAALQFYASESDKIRETSGQPAKMPWKLWVALAVTVAACIVPLVTKNKIYHTVQLCLNVIVLGFWCGQFLSYGLMVNWLSSGLSMWKGLIPILMVMTAFIYPIFGKRQHYCSHICPLGSVQQLAGRCCKRKINVSHNANNILEWFRRVLWAVLMFCLWIPVVTEWMDYELFSAFLVESASTVVLICGCAVVVLSLFINRPYCRFICPTGTLIKMEENMFNNIDKSHKI